MWTIEQEAARVAALLGRAGSLFTHSGGHLTDPSAAFADAADTSSAVADGDEESGAGARSAREVIAAGRAGLGRARAADAVVHREVNAAQRAVAAGAQSADHHRTRAEEVPARFGPWSDAPIATTAALHALRSRVLSAKGLVSSTAEASGRSAERVRAAGYGPDAGVP